MICEDTADRVIKRLPEKNMFISTLRYDTRGCRNISVGPTSVEGYLTVISCNIYEGTAFLRDIFPVLNFQTKINNQYKSYKELEDGITAELIMRFRNSDDLKGETGIKFFLFDTLYDKVIGELHPGNITEYVGKVRIPRFDSLNDMTNGNYFRSSNVLFRGNGEHFLVKDNSLKKIYVTDQKEVLSLLKLQDWAEENLMEVNIPSLIGSELVCDLFSNLFENDLLAHLPEIQMRTYLGDFLKGNIVGVNLDHAKELLNFVNMKG